MATAKKKVSAKKRRKKKIIIFAVEIVLLLIVLAVLFVALKLEKVDSGHTQDIEKTEKNKLTEEAQETQERYTTVAIFGLDNRSNGNFESGNSDVIMLASIDKETKEVKLVSVYRDTYMNLTDDGGYSKCNAAFNRGGVTQAVSMLNVNLDLDIDEYVVIDFKAVADAVDILGGVEIEVSAGEARIMEEFGYTKNVAEVTGKPYHPMPQGGGVYNLDGVQATAYARVRHVGNNDFERTERQRRVIQKMVEKALNSDLATINELADTVLADVKTSMTNTEILLLAKDAFSYSLGENTGFPFELGSASLKIPGISSKQDCVIPKDLASNVKQLHAFLFETEDYEVSARVQEISDEIVNRTGISKEDTP